MSKKNILYLYKTNSVSQSGNSKMNYKNGQTIPTLHMLGSLDWHGKEALLSIFRAYDESQWFSINDTPHHEWYVHQNKTNGIKNSGLYHVAIYSTCNNKKSYGFYDSKGGNKYRVYSIKYQAKTIAKGAIEMLNKHCYLVEIISSDLIKKIQKVGIEQYRRSKYSLAESYQQSINKIKELNKSFLEVIKKADNPILSGAIKLITPEKDYTNTSNIACQKNYEKLMHLNRYNNPLSNDFIDTFCKQFYDGSHLINFKKSFISSNYYNSGGITQVKAALLPDNFNINTVTEKYYKFTQIIKKFNDGSNNNYIETWNLSLKKNNWVISDDIYECIQNNVAELLYKGRYINGTCLYNELVKFSLSPSEYDLEKDFSKSVYDIIRDRDPIYYNILDFRYSRYKINKCYKKAILECYNLQHNTKYDFARFISLAECDQEVAKYLFKKLILLARHGISVQKNDHNGEWKDIVAHKNMGTIDQTEQQYRLTEHVCSLNELLEYYNIDDMQINTMSDLKNHIKLGLLGNLTIEELVSDNFICPV